MLQKLKEKIEKIASGFIPKDDATGVNKPGELSRQQLVNQILEHFQLSFAEETTDESMLYPTSFNIVLHPDDYAKRQQGFAQTSKDSASKFHKFLKGKLAQYADHIPHATYWSFQFSSCGAGDNVEAGNGSFSVVEAGEAIIMSSLYSIDFSAANMASGTNIKTTRKPQGSLTTESYNMNKDALLGMDILNKDKFRINFDKEFGAAKEPVSITGSDMEANAYAVLKFKEGSVSKSYFMIDQQIEISGKKDTRGGTKFLKLDSDDMINSHVIIKFEKNVFQIAAFGNTKLNSRTLKLSQGADITWYDLAKSSSILINDHIIIDFKAK
ncbi:hypothetical protein [Dysgonomonas termitidis]|uniref:FHA domain-containing protein n=1 Tax=Dysgonomonas termitidis TaxID=1516126 RepID=A0ABV9L468_9BACT